VALDIVVVANRHRPPVITAALGSYPHRIIETPDAALPPGFVPVREARAVYVKSQLGAYRCFRGHQTALESSPGDHILVLEDDANPNRDDWMAVVERGRRLLGDFEVVSLHGRDIRGVERLITVESERFATVKPIVRRRFLYSARLRWVQGSLAYLITAGAARRIVDSRYRGMPVDHLLANDFSFAVILSSPFDHDRRHGSLAEHPR
jgi:GR25 family glycosyltransferase involved in LPS biosynthesis